jgi:hypothetical protein
VQTERIIEEKTVGAAGGDSQEKFKVLLEDTGANEERKKVIKEFQ